MLGFWQKIWYSRAHPAVALGLFALGIVAGVIVATVSGTRIFASLLCLLLAIALLLMVLFCPKWALLGLAVAAGMLAGLWRCSIGPSGAAGQAAEKDWLMAVRDDYADSIRGNMGEEEVALGLSYLLGMKEGLTEDMAEKLRTVGLTHIVVASGTHLSILVEFARKIFGKISRAVGLIFALAMVVIFASMIGWTPSITRAAVVSILSLVMGYVGRKFRPLRLIILAMAITLMINPANLGALGWMLSFAAYAGIMLISPVLQEFFCGGRKPGLLGEMILTSLGATLACLPLQLYYFGELSLLALPANLLILPSIPYAMGLTFLAGAGGILTLLAQGAGRLAGLLLDCHLQIVGWLAEQRMFLIRIETYQVWTLWLYILVLAMVLAPWLWRKWRLWGQQRE